MHLKGVVESIRASAIEAVSGLRKLSGIHPSTTAATPQEMPIMAIDSPKSPIFNDDISEIGGATDRLGFSPLQMQNKSFNGSASSLRPVAPSSSPKIETQKNKIRLHLQEQGDKISQVVEERLLFAVFDKYKSEGVSLRFSSLLSFRTCPSSLLGIFIFVLLFWLPSLHIFSYV